MPTVIKSISNTDKDILDGIRLLYLNNDTFDIDPTYSTGKIYRGTEEPKRKYDLNPQIDGVLQADCRSLPEESNSVNSIVFDPPFMFGTHGQTKNNIMTKRFTMFDTWRELEQMYCQSLEEFVRILRKGGYLIFKCQDYTDSKTTMTHCLVYNWATSLGLYAEDIFILSVNGGRIYNPLLNQRHARKFHCYYWVFRK